MVDQPIGRRRFLKGAGAAGTAAAAALTGALPAAAQQAAPSAPAQQQASSPARVEPLHTLTPTEAAFLGAVYDTFIPADQYSPSGTDCGLVVYIDRQLAGAWGNGARFYRSGPSLPASPSRAINST
ncbi:MAG TPA: gluconate 2-dehydrogenase subunit 3 family protein [Stellaceae bacterium]|jgi:gluconate 2-dehydrogenase gamma chain